MKYYKSDTNIAFVYRLELILKTLLSQDAGMLGTCGIGSLSRLGVVVVVVIVVVSVAVVVVCCCCCSSSSYC